MSSSTRHAVVIGALAIAALAAPASGAVRVSYDERFTTRSPGTPTGWWFHIRHRDTAGGTPPALTRTRLELPSGARFDGDALPKCRASDDELTAQGRSACPDASFLGDGTATVITGFGTPVDPFPVEVFFYNGGAEVITVAERRGTGRTLAVERTRVSGSTVTNTGSPPPGAPPDGKSSITDLVWDIPPRGRWLTTPPRCPRSGRWVTRATFGYDDGSSSSDTAVHACTPPDRATRRARRRAHVSVRRVAPRRGCVRRRLVVLVNSSPRRARVRLRLDGRRARTLPRRRMRLRIGVARLRAGRHVLAARATSPGRRPAAARLRFRRC